MNFVLAFFIAGTIGAVGWLAFTILKKNVLLTFIVLLALGALLSASGVTGLINAACPGSLPPMLLGLGVSFYDATLLAFAGDWALFVIMAGIIVLMIVTGIVTALLMGAGKPKPVQAEPDKSCV